MSFLGALMTSASLGLYPNTILGDAYLVPFRNGKLSRALKRDVYDITLIVGYRGGAGLLVKPPKTVEPPLASIPLQPPFDPHSQVCRRVMPVGYHQQLLLFSGVHSVLDPDVGHHRGLLGEAPPIHRLIDYVLEEIPSVGHVISRVVVVRSACKRLEPSRSRHGCLLACDLCPLASVVDG